VIKKYDGKIGFRELLAIIFFCIALKLSDTTPLLLLDEGLNAAWAIPILSGLVIFLFCFFYPCLNYIKTKI